MNSEFTSEFTLTPPIKAGIPAEAIHRFLDRLELYQVYMHSVLIMRHNKLVAEGYYAPYRADTLHRMFSICKTMNALAVGLLCEEGRLCLTDTVVSYCIGFCILELAPQPLLQPLHFPQKKHCHIPP